MQMLCIMLIVLKGLNVSGREQPVLKGKWNICLAVCDFFEQHEYELLNIADLVMKMGEYCEQPYSTKWMETKLLQHYDRQILVVNKYGKRDVVMFCVAACDILHDYHKMERSERLKAC